MRKTLSKSKDEKKLLKDQRIVKSYITEISSEQTKIKKKNRRYIVKFTQHCSK